MYNCYHSCLLYVFKQNCFKKNYLYKMENISELALNQEPHGCELSTLCHPRLMKGSVPKSIVNKNFKKDMQERKKIRRVEYNIIFYRFLNFFFFLLLLLFIQIFLEFARVFWYYQVSQVVEVFLDKYLVLILSAEVVVQVKIRHHQFHS